MARRAALLPRRQLRRAGSRAAPAAAAGAACRRRTAGAASRRPGEAVLRQPLRLAPRAGGERLVLRPGGPARALKQACQEAGIPAWRRAWLPLLWAGDTLVLAAGLGMHRRWPAEAAAPRWRVEWHAQPPQVPGAPR
ncbi:tRNA lysidine(34) synthetase TilS [Cupriavidus oxalaticus]|uniref:tRNA lysidine(34) synthetase TilS n=1 Tax=Cupriavidus oxalaticus TaxID=96344 RepID=UPI003F4921E4